MTDDTYIHRLRPAGPGRPLLFLFHGTGGDEDQFFALGPQLLPGAGVASPRGDVSEHGANRFFRRAGEGVYDMADLVLRTRKMASFVAANVAEQQPSAVAGLGYSNGANILASVIFANPEMFDAAVLMHPLIPFRPRIDGSLAGRRILVTAGRRDPICPRAQTEALAGYLREAGAQVDVLWHDGGHEIRPAEIAAARDFLAPLHVTQPDNQGGFLQ